MCGFIVCKNQHQAVEQDLLINAVQKMAHRGPDYSSIWISDDNKTGLGHARLGVIDLETGNQPIVNKQHKISIVVNGEFYGYKKIREELKIRGYQFETASDSEILVFLYLEYGLDFVEHLRGEFSFVLYDETNDKVIAARDRFGIKPLVYNYDNNRLLIASEAKALFAFGIEQSWDESSMMNAVTMQYQATDRTFFKNIYQLMPGHMLVYQNGTLSTHQYWDLDYPKQNKNSTNISEDSSINRFKELLDESIHLRLDSDVPVCFHLSGGLDSSTVAGMSKQYLSEKMQCFTISFSDTDYDELELARETAEFLNADLHEIHVTETDILSHLEDAVYYSEGLAINGHLSCKYLLNKVIHQAGFKVALTGEGSDEVLAGYPHLRQDLLNILPDNRKKTLLTNLLDDNLVSRGVQLAQGNELNLNPVEKRLGFIPSFLRAKASFGYKMHQLLSSDFLEHCQQANLYRLMIDSYDVKKQLKHAHPVNQSLYLWTKLTLVNYILGTLGDGAEMAHSVEGRLPFLDHHLFEFCRELPMDLKIKNGNEKYILKEAAKPFVTKHVYHRKKHPFMAPPVIRVKNSNSYDFILDTLSESNVENLGFFDSKKVNKLLGDLKTMTDHELIAHEPIIMFLLTSFYLDKKFYL